MNKDDEIEALKEKVNFYRYDHLTGLKQRSDFEYDLEKKFYRSKQLDASFYMAFYDVEGLHEINRIDGYRAGDRLLVEVANALRLQYDASEVYRISGDEFIVFYAKKPLNTKVNKASVAVVKSCFFETPDEMFSCADEMLSEIKKHRKKRRTDI